MVERLLPSDDPIAEEVLEWTIRRDSKDITQLMRWMETTEIRRDRQVLLHRAMDLMDEIQYEEGNAKSLKGIVKKNMGGVEVTGKELRKCIGVKNSKDFQKKFEAREREKLQMDDKGNVTGKEVFAYFVNPETGEEIEIGSKHYRSKGGSTDKTSNTLKFSPSLQKCFKSGKKQ